MLESCEHRTVHFNLTCSEMSASFLHVHLSCYPLHVHLLCFTFIDGPLCSEYVLAPSMLTHISLLHASLVAHMQDPHSGFIVIWSVHIDCSSFYP